jgi:hypothetical protein
MNRSGKDIQGGLFRIVFLLDRDSQYKTGEISFGDPFGNHLEIPSGDASSFATHLLEGAPKCS